MKAHFTKVSVAFLFAALVLGCQDMAPVGPDGLVPQFTHKNGEHGNRGGKDDDRTIFEVTFTTHGLDVPPNAPNLFTLTTRCATTVNHKLWATIFADCMVAIEPMGSTIDNELIRVSVFPRVKAGKVTAIDMYFHDDNVPGSGTTYGTGLLLRFEVEDLDNGGFIVHMHADDVDLKERKNSPSIGTVSIGDAVYSPVL